MFNVNAVLTKCGNFLSANIPRTVGKQNLYLFFTSMFMTVGLINIGFGNTLVVFVYGILCGIYGTLMLISHKKGESIEN